MVLCQGYPPARELREAQIIEVCFVSPRHCSVTVWVVEVGNHFGWMPMGPEAPKKSKKDKKGSLRLEDHASCGAFIF